MKSTVGELNDEIETLVAYIRAISDFNMNEALGRTQDHIGAIVVDAILQSGINYLLVVKPRVDHLRADFPEARTTSGFLALADRVGLCALIRWNGRGKIETILAVARFLRDEGVQTHADLRAWLDSSLNVDRLKQLRGIGNMTADYFKMLAGIETIAPDGLISGFLARAGLTRRSYHHTREILVKAARRLGVSPIALGFSIWEHKAGAR